MREQQYSRYKLEDDNIIVDWGEPPGIPHPEDILHRWHWTECTDEVQLEFLRACERNFDRQGDAESIVNIGRYTYEQLLKTANPSVRFILQ